MTTEDITYILDAEDKATAKIKKAEKALKEDVKTIRETGEASKKSTELVGTFAGTLVGPEFGSFAQKGAEMTERLTQMSAGLKEGGKSAVLFKAGLVGLVAVVSFKVGNAIGNAIFQTGKYKKQLEEADKAAKQLATEGMALLAKSTSKLTPEIQDKNIAGLKRRLAAAKVDMEMRPSEVRELAKRLEQAKKIGKELVMQEQSAGRIAKEERRAAAAAKLKLSQDYVRQLREENELLGKSAFQQDVIRANRAGLTGAHARAALIALRKKHEFIDAEKKAIELKKNADKAEAERIKQMSKDRMQAIKDERAASERLHKQKRGQLDSQIDKLREQLGAISQGGKSESSQGVDQRFSSGRREVRDAQRDQRERIANNQKRDKLLEQIRKLLAEKENVDPVVVNVRGS